MGSQWYRVGEPTSWIPQILLEILARRRGTSGVVGDHICLQRRVLRLCHWELRTREPAFRNRRPWGLGEVGICRLAEEFQRSAPMRALLAGTHRGVASDQAPETEAWVFFFAFRIPAKFQLVFSMCLLSPPSLAWLRGRQSRPELKRFFNLPQKRSIGTVFFGMQP